MPSSDVLREKENMAIVSSIDTFMNQGRSSLLSALSKAPENVQLQSIFWIIAILMAAVMVMELRKGREERKGIWGPLAILLFCISVIFGFSTTLIGWVIMFSLAIVLAGKFKQGEWKGCIMILIMIYFLAYIVSSSPVMMIFIAAVVSITGAFIKKRNSDRDYGSGEASRMMKDQGYNVRKERRIIRGLRKIAHASFHWSKDKLLRGVSAIKQRAAERELRNIEQQEHEAEVAAAGKALAETVDDLEKKEIEYEKRDWEYIREMLKQCQALKRRLQSDDNEQELQKDVIQNAKAIMDPANKLVKDKLEEEALNERSTSIFRKCIHVMEKSAKEMKQLEESRAAFRELRNTLDSMIKDIKKEIVESLKGIDKAREEAEHSNIQGAHERVNLLKERHSALEDVDKKLGQIGSYADQVMHKLMQVNIAEDKRMAQVDAIAKQAEKHEKKIEHFEKGFKKADDKLRSAYKEFEHDYSKGMGEIVDQSMVELTKSVVQVLHHVGEISKLALDFNKDELKALVNEMAQVSNNIYELSRTSEYLAKMYYYFDEAIKDLTEMAQVVDQKSESKEKIQDVLKTDDLVETLDKRAYRKGKHIFGHIKAGYQSLQDANHFVDEHVRMLERYANQIPNVEKEVNEALMQAFNKVMGREIKQARQLGGEAGKAEAEMQKAEHYAKAAKAAAR